MSRSGGSDSRSSLASEAPAPPVARVAPKVLEAHGHKRTDQYYWLRDRDDPEVMAYLEAENRYTNAMMSHTEQLQEELYQDIVGRIQQDDASVPYLMRGFYYYDREEKGKGYPVYCRKQGTLQAAEQILLDVNELAKGRDYTSVSSVEVSQDNRLLAYAIDHVGRRKYELRFLRIEDKRLLEDRILDVTGDVVWAADHRTVFYTRQDPETLRSYQVYRHTLGDDQSADAIVFQEDDETYSVTLDQSKSLEYLFVVSSQTLRTEVRYLALKRPDDELRMIEPRGGEHEYWVDHFGDRFYIRTNTLGKNFHLMSTPASSPGRENWQEVIPHREDVFFTDFEVFRSFLVLEERRAGLMRFRVRPWGDGEQHELEFEEPAYAAWLGANEELETDTLRYVYSSLKTPPSTFDYDMRTREHTLLKRERVLGGFDSTNYVVERLDALVRDGESVPVSLVYRSGLERDGSHPLVLYAYGSYGSSTEAGFNSSALSLLDRGFAFAIAHVRGGQELGYRWYEDGKLLNKKNTFTDFVDCAEMLVGEGYTAKDRLFARGASAGGLLMGAVINLRPDLFRGVVADVPFVDVITTMQDPSIPLTTFEYDEWGDPVEKRYYDYMLSYSPYDNVEAKEYPHLLVTSGLHDSQVQYWEPAKWVARLRALKTGDNRLLLKTNMDAGHGGVSGRYRRFREQAFEFAFLLDLAPRAPS